MADLQSTKLVAVAAVVSPYDQWSLGAGADKVSAVNSQDDATSYVAANSAGRLQLYTLNPAAIAGAARVHSVSVRVRAQTPSGAGDASVQYGWAYLSYQQFAQADLTPGWTTYDLPVSTLNPLTGLPWTVSEVSNIVVGLVSVGASTSDRRVSLVNLVAVVTFESVAALHAAVRAQQCAGAVLNVAIKRTIVTSANSGQLQAIVQERKTVSTSLHAAVRLAGVMTAGQSLQAAVRTSVAGPAVSLQAQVQGVVPKTASANVHAAVRKSSASPRAYLEARVIQLAATPPANLRTAVRVLSVVSPTTNLQTWVVVPTSASASLQAVVQKKGSGVGGVPVAQAQCWVALRWQPAVALLLAVRRTASTSANLQTFVVVRVSATAAVHCAVIRLAKTTTASLHARVVTLTASSPVNIQAVVRRTVSTAASLHAWVVTRVSTSTSLQTAVKRTVSTSVNLQAAVGTRTAATAVNLQTAIRRTVSTAANLHARVLAYTLQSANLQAAVRRTLQVLVNLQTWLAERKSATANPQCAVAARVLTAANVQCAIVTRVRVTGVALHAQVSAVIPAKLRVYVFASATATLTLRAYIRRTAQSGAAILSYFVLQPTPAARVSALHVWVAVRSAVAAAALQSVVIPSGKYVSCALHARVVDPPSTSAGGAGNLDASAGAP